MNINLSDCISPTFDDLHIGLKKEEYDEVWCKGGRGSTKSSFISIEIILGILRDPDANATAGRRYDNELRDSVFSQLLWAINLLGVERKFKCTVSPMRITLKKTGQMIIFKGADNPKKTKSITLVRGYIKYVWLEEIDQYAGMDEIRVLLQSYFRGTEKQQIAFFSFNPPKSARSWVNQEVKISKKRRKVHHSDYRGVPKEWLGSRFIAEALHLKDINEKAYDHEYLGEEIGTGLEVFNNVTLRPITDTEISYFNNINQGIDFGYTTDPLSFVQVSYDARLKKLYIFFDLSGIRLKYSDLAERLTQLQKNELTMADKASPRDIDQLRDDYGFNIIGADKPPGSVDFGTKWLQDLEEIIIDPIRAPLPAKEFINYCLLTTRAGEVINQFPDKDNHSIDAVRYACVNIILQAKLLKNKKPVNIEVIPVANRW
jgi:PBSX family phage terminase large subunit